MKPEIMNDMRPKVRYWVPAAAMDETDLRTELRSLKERGFGGVEIVTLQTLPAEILCGKEGWGTERWDRMMEVIASETDKLGLSMDPAIGPGWPIASPAVTDADDPASLYELSYGLTEIEGPKQYDGPLPKQRVIRPEGTSKLLYACAYRSGADGVLCRDSLIELIDLVRDGAVTFDVPDGKWILFAFYEQPSAEKINGSRTYVVDHLSESGARAVEAYWDSVFEKNEYPSMESFFCDSLEYHVAMDWTRGFEKLFLETRGYDIRPYLPVVGFSNLYPAGDIPGFSFEDDTVGVLVNNDYAELLTECYCKHHLQTLRRTAAKYGKTLRYQVAYNKAFSIDRSALYVDIPENEALGRSTLDSQRTMSAGAHFGRKARHSFECAAEFLNCYAQSFEDLFWWVRRSLMCGMNAQVLHGASYSGRMQIEGKAYPVKWPGYEGFGKTFSENWNRKPDVRHERYCIDAVSRLNTVFRKKAKIDLLILRESYTSDGLGSEFCLYDDDGALLRAGYSYEFVSSVMLRHENAQVRNGILDPEGAAYRALIVPAKERLGLEALQSLFLLAEEGFPVIFAGKGEIRPFFLSEQLTEEKRKQYEKAKQMILDGKCLKADSYSDVPLVLRHAGILPRIQTETGEDIMTAVREDAEDRYYAFYAFSRVRINPDAPGYLPATIMPGYAAAKDSKIRTVHFAAPGTGKAILVDYWSGEEKAADIVLVSEGILKGTISLKADELIILKTRKSADFLREKIVFEDKEMQTENLTEIRVNWERLSLYEFRPDREEETSFLRSGFSKEALYVLKSEEMDILRPWKEILPELLHFTGKGIYEGSVMIPRLPKDSEIFLQAGNVRDTFTVRVNTKEAPFPHQDTKTADLTGLLKEGMNRIEVTVVSSLYNRARSEEDRIYGYPLPYLPESYGMYEGEEKKVRIYRR